MRIAVCIKQVPAVSEGTMDETTGVMIRTGKSVCNVYDLSALEAALRLKDLSPETTQVDAFTMGPASAEAVLREGYAMGVDTGFLLCDRAFAGADVLATSYTLAAGLRAAGAYDLIVCGRQTTDGDTGQVGGAIAQWLALAHATGVTAIAPEGDALRVTQSISGDVQTLRMPLPCLLTVERAAFVPRMPALRLKLAAAKKPLSVLTQADLQATAPHFFGLSGSATKVERIFTPEPTPRRAITTLSGDAGAETLANLLTDLSRREVST